MSEVFTDSIVKEAEGIVDSINSVPTSSRHDYLNGRISSIGAFERDEATKYINRLSNPTGVAGSQDRAKYKLTELSNELANKMELLMAIIDSSNSTEDIKCKAQSQLDGLTEYSVIALNILATLR